MQVIATDRDDIDAVDEAGDDHRRDHREPAPPSRLHQRHDEREVAADDEHHRGDPEPVRPSEVREVGRPAVPVQLGAFFDDPGVGDDLAVVAHAKDLVHDR